MIRKLLLLSALAVAAALAQPSTEHKAIKVDPKIFDGYEGRYQLPNIVLNITREGDHLFAQGTGQRRFEIFPESEKEYFATAPPVQISFKTGDDGKATELVLHQAGTDRPAKRIPGEPLRPRKAIALDPKIMEKYAGRYQMAPDRFFLVTLENGHLMTVTLK